MAIVFFGSAGEILRTVDEPAISPDQIPDEDVLVLRRVLAVLMRDKMGMTPVQIRAAFAAAKRAID